MHLGIPSDSDTKKSLHEPPRDIDKEETSKAQKHIDDTHSSYWDSVPVGFVKKFEKFPSNFGPNGGDVDGLKAWVRTRTSSSRRLRISSKSSSTVTTKQFKVIKLQGTTIEQTFTTFHIKVTSCSFIKTLHKRSNDGNEHQCECHQTTPKGTDVHPNQANPGSYGRRQSLSLRVAVIAPTRHDGCGNEGNG